MNNRIKKVRQELKMTQDEFSKKIGVSFSSVSKLEKGINNPSEQTIRAICREFSINRYWLETGNGDMHEEYNFLRIDEIIQILSGNIEQARINAVVEILEMTPEEFHAWESVLGAFQTYSRWKGAANEEKAEQ